MKKVAKAETASVSDELITSGVLDAGTDYRQGLYDGLVRNLQEVDGVWRVESEAAILSLGLLEQKRVELDEEIARLKERCDARSKSESGRRKALARAALKLSGIEPGLAGSKRELFVLGARLETGMWIEDGQIENMANNLALLDEACKRGDPIAYFRSGEFNYLLQPEAGSSGLEVKVSEDPEGSWDYKYVSFAIPCACIFRCYGNDTYKSRLDDNGVASLNGCLMTHVSSGENNVLKQRNIHKATSVTNRSSMPGPAGSKEDAFIVGREAIIGLLTRNNNRYDYDSLSKNQQFKLWLAASALGILQAETQERLDASLVDECIELLEDFVAPIYGYNSVPDEYYRKQGSYKLPTAIYPALQLLIRTHSLDALFQQVSGKVSRYDNLGVFSRPEFLKAAFDAFVVDNAD